MLEETMYDKAVKINAAKVETDPYHNASNNIFSSSLHCLINTHIFLNTAPLVDKACL